MSIKQFVLNAGQQYIHASIVADMMGIVTCILLLLVGIWGTYRCVKLAMEGPSYNGWELASIVLFIIIAIIGGCTIFLTSDILYAYLSPTTYILTFARSLL